MYRGAFTPVTYLQIHLLGVISPQLPIYYQFVKPFIGIITAIIEDISPRVTYFFEAISRGFNL